MANRYPDRALTFLPGWDSVMALQFENLVLNNSAQVTEALDCLLWMFSMRHPTSKPPRRSVVARR